MGVVFHPSPQKNPCGDVRVPSPRFPSWGTGRLGQAVGGDETNFEKGDGGGGSAAVCLGVTLWGCRLWRGRPAAAKDQQALAASATAAAIRQPCLSSSRCLRPARTRPLWAREYIHLQLPTSSLALVAGGTDLIYLPHAPLRDGTHSLGCNARFTGGCHISPIGVPGSFPPPVRHDPCASLVAWRREMNRERILSEPTCPIGRLPA